MKRIFLFLLTNLLITITLSIVGSIVLTAMGQDPSSYAGLLIFSFIFGFAGAIISLLMSKTMAKQSVGAQTITTPRNEAESWLLQTVGRQAQMLGIKMPEVAIYQAQEMNAFATGAFKNSALVAVSTGLMQQMNRDEVEAVLAHEMSHVNNGDMVTLALLQGLANTFVIFFSRLVANVVINAISKDSDNARGLYYIVYMALQVAFMTLGNIVIFWFSRKREYAADSGSAQLVGSRKMIAALRKLQQPHGPEKGLPDSIEAFGIASEKKDSLFSTHPSLENRIAALEQGSYLAR